MDAWSCNGARGCGGDVKMLGRARRLDVWRGGEKATWRCICAAAAAVAAWARAAGNISTADDGDNQTRDDCTLADMAAATDVAAAVAGAAATTRGSVVRICNSHTNGCCSALVSGASHSSAAAKLNVTEVSLAQLEAPRVLLRLSSSEALRGVGMKQQDDERGGLRRNALDGKEPVGQEWLSSGLNRAHIVR